MESLVWSARPTLRKGVLVCAFYGWNDGGEAATGQRAQSRAGYQPMACAPRRGSAPPRRTPSLPTTEAQTAPARQS